MKKRLKRLQKRKSAKKRKWQQIAAADKSYAMKTSASQRKADSHMMWKDGAFQMARPDPPPKLNVKVTVMHTAHRKFGKIWRERVILESTRGNILKG